MQEARLPDGPLIQQTLQILEGATLEEIGAVAEVLAARVVAEMPDINQAGRLFGVAVTRSARLIREKASASLQQ